MSSIDGSVLDGVLEECRSALGALADPIEQCRDTAAFLGRIDRRNLRMLTNTAEILARPSVADWRHHSRLAREEIPRATRNFLLAPDDMDDFQRHCPVAGYVSTPADGILAGYTPRGRASVLAYPHTGFTQQLPYFECADDRLNGANPGDGAFFGVAVDGETTWLWESAFDHRMAPRDGTGLLEIEYERDRPASGTAAAVDATEVTYVLPGTDAVVRDLTVRNVGDRRIDEVVHYARINANERQQYPPGVTSENRVRAREGGVTWTDLESDVALRVAADVDAGSDRPEGRESVASGPTAYASPGPLSELREAATDVARGTHVGGFVAVPVDLAPGESVTVTAVVRGLEGDRPDVLDRPAAARQSIAADRWREWLADVPVDRIPDDHAAQYERSLVGMLSLFDPGSASVSAAPNVQPVYYPSWPRDGAFVAIALAEAGLAEPAKRYLAEFLADVQEDDGGFTQCYTSDGASAGIIPRENDQQPIFCHAVRAVYERTGDDAFLEEAWPAVRAAADYTVDAVADNDLLAATPDFAEMWADARQSLWTNAFAYRGLLDAAAMAATLGEDDHRYRATAERIGRAIDRHFFAETDDGPDDGAFATHFTVWGAERDDNVAFSAGAHPTGWAGDFGRRDAVLESFTEVYRDRDDYWLPREFVLAAALYDDDRTEVADRIVAELAEETLPGGTLAEEVTDGGDHEFAALAWANAGFVHALHVRAGSGTAGTDDGSRERIRADG